ncbi:hypothetical protein HS088_TW20G00713 [Tripterygium wilfordii]|uniref:Uncharacterized protein n=1 Tax=Tripterygium wilfordii TaxID=458696 RepID=A0A7J7C8B1_TRIWF|nr:hypothetical protein HS088_TW20G00713 [Tripterygium wilfordii]
MDNDDLKGISALGEGSTTSVSNLPGIRGFNKLLEVWVPEITTKARLLLLDPAAAELGWLGGRCNCTHTWTQLCWATSHCLCHLCLLSQEQHHHQRCTNCNI